MSKVIVTGANGFVGNHLIKELLGHGYSVTAIGGPQIAASKPSLIKDADYISLDLTQANEVQKIDFSSVTAVVHLAGLAAIGESFNKPMQYISTNIGIEFNLFETALAQNASPRFLIVSSGNVYDPKATQPLSESSPVLPSSPYAISKLGQEQMSQYYGTRGFNYIIARPFNHIGTGQGLGFLVPDLTQQVIAVERGKSSEVLVGNLDAKRDYTDVHDIVRAYRLLLEKGRSGEIYNVCSGRALSGHEILAGLCQASMVKPSIKQDPNKMRPSDTPLLVGNHEKLTKDTGWQPEIPLETTLADVIADWRKR